MTPTKPYMIRAFYDWILDNEKTPYIVVNATLPQVQVPQNYVEDGKIVLNISPRAVQKLKLGNDRIEFVAKFSGLSVPIFIPTHAVFAVYAKENGKGMVFPEHEEEDTTPPTPPTTTPPTGTGSDKSKNKVSHLRVVK